MVRPAILWNDQRTAAECEEIERRVGLARLIELTGNRALTGFTAPKLLWMAHHEPELFGRVRSIMLPKDYVRLHLTGEHAIDVADASGTLLFDVANRRWSQEMLAAIGVDEAMLPVALESPEATGATREGMPVTAGVTVAAGAGDQAAGALGVGIGRPGPASIVLGTSGVVFAALPGFRPDPQARAHVFCHAVPQTWHAMGVMLSAAGSLRWFRDAFMPGASYDHVLAGAEAIVPGAQGAMFAPYLSGERTPYPDPDVRGAFVGLSLEQGPGVPARAVLEGVAYALRDQLELLREMGVEVSVGRVSGGGARSRLWLEIVASVLEIPLELMAVEEGAAYGAALLGGVAAGVFADVEEAIACCVRVTGTVEPVREWTPAYREGYERFRGLYPAIRHLHG